MSASIPALRRAFAPPKTLFAIEVAQHGDPAVLRGVERPDPVPSGASVLVRNRFVGVNYVDLQHRAGRPYPVELPLIPGIEGAGEIVAVGPLADPALIGRNVAHFGHMAGNYAELVAVDPDFYVVLDDDTPLDVACAVAMAGTTAYVLCREASAPGPGDTVVVNAAAGATGGALVALCAAAGATVIGVASTAEKAAAARELGATHALVGPQVEQIVELTGGAGASIVYDAGGRDTFDVSLSMLATRGTLVLYGQSSGPVAPFDPGRLSGITGEGRAGSLTVRWVSASNDYLRTGADRARAMRAVLAAGVPSRIAGRFPLARAADAHALLASRGVSGKLLLDVPSAQPDG